MRKRKLPIALIVAAIGCSGDADHAEIQRTTLPFEPVSEGQLRIEAEVPLLFGAILAVDSSTLVAADRLTNDVWVIDASAPDIAMRRVIEGQDRKGAKLVAISVDSSGWQLLDRSGTVYHFSGSGWELIGTSTLDLGGALIQAAESDGHGGYAVLVRRMGRQGGSGLESALLLVGGDGSVRTGWTMPVTNSPDASILSLSRAAEGWVVARTEPAALLYFDRTGALVAERPIERIAARPLTREIVEEFERLAPGSTRNGARLPSHFPAFTSVRADGDNMLAVPYVGGPTGEAQGLDVYCNNRYSHTVLDAPNLQQVLLTDHGIVAIVENSRLSYSIRFYRASDEALQCGQTS